MWLIVDESGSGPPLVGQWIRVGTNGEIRINDQVRGKMEGNVVQLTHPETRGTDYRGTFSFATGKTRLVLSGDYFAAQEAFIGN